MVNSDLIKFVEQSPDTVITLMNGEKILVREHADEVLHRIVQFRRSILQGVSAVLGQVSVMAPASEAEPAKTRESTER
jgi:flagellar protein FlbD